MRHLVVKSLSLAWPQARFRALLVIILAKFIGQLLLSELMVEISKGGRDLVNWYGGTLFLMAVLSLYVQDFTTWVVYTSQGKFNEDAWNDYSRISFTSRRVATAELFVEKKEKCVTAIFLIVDWGLPTVVQMISTLFSCIYTFWRAGLTIYLLALLGVCVILYYLFIREEQNSFTQIHKLLRNENSSLKEKLTLWLPEFQSGEIPPETMIDIEAQMFANNRQVELQWNKIMGRTTIISELLISIITTTRNYGSESRFYHR